MSVLFCSFLGVETDVLTKNGDPPPLKVDDANKKPFLEKVIDDEPLGRTQKSWKMCFIKLPLNLGLMYVLNNGKNQRPFTVNLPKKNGWAFGCAVAGNEGETMTQGVSY